MSKFVKTQYGTPKQILKFPDHYVALAVTVDNTGIVAGADGKKIVPAGTIVGGGFLADDTKKATVINDATSEGVLLNDVDVTHGPAPGAVVIHGFISTSKLPTAPAATAITALKQITFVK
ncbi:hypothetical protein HP567_013045 [Brevibacillus sp. M2.1A]|uniref:hypothetical protein n=1 Tax=Brevibacillus sp. M2.1A TaxID=2738980 RepID=UPI00156BAD5F|nr:hypothetical protein [Brevibacillus sp. M2.1A]MCC8435472.1 hypothetical protein [Brevibacillus sp. M2.1A]